MSDTQYARWSAALAGAKLDTGERGNPPSGFFRRNAGARGWEAFSIFRDPETHVLSCIRNIFGDGSKMSAEEIDELFAGEIYPIPYDVYVAVAEEGKPWPKEHTARLTLAEVKAGTQMTPELARGRTGADVEAAPAPMGHNNPPEDMTPDQRLAAEIEATSAAATAWLKGIGGKPSTKAEADLVANYATKFGQFSKSATDFHKVEKQPHLDAGRAVDGKWFPVRDRAETLRKRCRALGNAWIDAEKARRAEEARKANEAAQEAARKQGGSSDAPPTPVAPIEPERVTIGTARTVSQRERTVWTVTDLPAFAAYVAAMQPPPPDFIALCNQIAHKLGVAGVAAPGIAKEIRRTAA